MQGDLGKFLKARVNYTDAQGSSKTAESMASNAVIPAGPNQPPAFPSPTQPLTVNENATSGNLGLPPATDPQNDELAYSVSGRDEVAFREDFTLQPVTGDLRVKPNATIDYESRQSYLVTINVHDGLDTSHNPDTGIDASLTLTIDVNNLDDAGTVEISSEHPEVDTAIRATLTDPDGNVRGTSWQWYRGASRNGSFTPIENATGRSYTPVQADARQYLRVRATYTDGHGAAKEAEAVTRNATTPVSTNQAAFFRSEHITFNVPENSSSGHLVGDVSVTDPNGDQLYYGLHHTSHLDYQADYFKRTCDLGYDNGRITVKQGVVLDYEHESPLTVTIKLTDELDPFGEYDYLWDDTVTLTIKVTNIDEPGTLDLEHVRSTTGAPTEVDVSFARLSDPDGVNRIVSWEWFRGDTQDGPFTEIDSGPFSDGTESGFRPEESDIGKYLKVRVTYADVFSDSSGRMKAVEQTMGPVERWVSPNPDYAFWPGRWHDAGDLAVGGTQSGVIQGGFDANGRYVNDVIDYFELTGMTAGTTYQLNLREPGAGGGHIVGFYTTDGAGLYFEFRGDMQNDGYGSAQLRQALFTPSSSGRHFVSIRGVFATQDINYTVALVAPAADDIPDSVSTTAEGATFGSGVIEKLYDVDWHRTNNLSSSTQYLAYLKGAAANGLFDPYIVGVYDPQGNLIAGTSDNRRGIGRDASVLFTPPSYGRYYIAVSSAPEPFRPRTTRDSTGKGHTGAYVLTVTNPSGDASNYRGSTTQRMGPSGGIATVNQEYTFDYALEHNYDEEYVKIAVKPGHVYEIYIKETNPWDTAPSIRARLDTSYDIYSGPSHGCWNPYSSHAVFKSLEFSETTRDYFVRVKVGDSGGVSGKIAIRLLDTSGDNLSNYESRCD